jgi:hypothetical protein
MGRPLIYGYTPENTVVNAQKLDDTEDIPLGRNLRVITVRVVHQIHVVLPSLTKRYHWRYKHGLKK